MSENNSHREEIFSRRVPAGKRTYFFDVKSTRTNDYYITITESKRQMGDDGRAFYQKHKIFLYREDFEKFMESFTAAMKKAEELYGSAPPSTPAPANEPVPERREQKPGSSFTDVSFDDLG